MWNSCKVTFSNTFYAGTYQGRLTVHVVQHWERLRCSSSALQSSTSLTPHDTKKATKQHKLYTNTSNLRTHRADSIGGWVTRVVAFSCRSIPGAVLVPRAWCPFSRVPSVSFSCDLRSLEKQFSSSKNIFWSNWWTKPGRANNYAFVWASIEFENQSKWNKPFHLTTITNIYSQENLTSINLANTCDPRHMTEKNKIPKSLASSLVRPMKSMDSRILTLPRQRLT